MTRKNSLLNSALIASLSLVISALSHAQSPTSDGSPASINARADYFRLDNAYIPPPGEALHHYTAGFAKILCSAVFVTGLDPVDAAANMGGFISPFNQRQHVVNTRVDRVREEVSLVLPDGVMTIRAVLHIRLETIASTSHLLLLKPIFLRLIPRRGQWATLSMKTAFQLV